MRNRWVLAGGLALAFAAGLPVRGQSASDAYRALGVKPADVLSGTTLSAELLPGGRKQLVCVTTLMTGKRDEVDAVKVRLDVFDVDGEKLTPIYQRDFGGESGVAVGDGNLQLVDLDRDGKSEIVVSWRSFADPLIEQRVGEVIVHDEGGFRAGWSGAFEYDATRAARDVPAERRDRYTREIDLAATLRTRGVTLFMTRKVIAVAGERLAEPKVVQETFPLRTREGW